MPDRTPVKDASTLYEVDLRATHAARAGFRISELRLTGAQSVPWHCHSHVSDTFYVLDGRLRIFLRDPQHDVALGPGETLSVAPRRPHRVTNPGPTPATFLVLQGIGEYDFVPLADAD